MVMAGRHGRSMLRKQRSGCRDGGLTGSPGGATFVGMSTSALLTTRGHIDLLRVASAACCRRGRGC
ncbi:putative leader peptide [Streptomyces sp. MspMP-M5]|uniref:putative leader peptide n=1 Tax=Streptomyces sp. MspMP-M5 TaxID=1155718 RepID=UPI003B634340